MLTLKKLNKNNTMHQSIRVCRKKQIKIFYLLRNKPQSKLNLIKSKPTSRRWSRIDESRLNLKSKYETCNSWTMLRTIQMAKKKVMMRK